MKREAGRVQRAEGSADPGCALASFAGRCALATRPVSDRFSRLGPEELLSAAAIARSKLATWTMDLV
jgi:hypothetical protein